MKPARSDAVCADALATLAEAVADWQRTHGRHDLPWQRTDDPYRVWLSEIMLQQTQVATVQRYYERFLERFATVEALAAAAPDEVMALWAGLGYYSRARHLHRCAQCVVAQHGGRFPSRAAELQRLPGIGRSTAAAIAVFCYGERAAILDGNVKRVLTRVLGFDKDLSQARHERELWQVAETHLPASGAQVKSYTQGLMDLGARVCTARSPACGRCPLAGRCVAWQQGQPQSYPVKNRPTARAAMAHALLWLRCGDDHWLVRRPASGIWAGLWSLPQFDSVAAAQRCARRWPAKARQLPAFVHVLTHRDWTLTPLQVDLPPPKPADAALRELWPEGRWVSTADLAAYGLPAPIRQLLSRALRPRLAAR